MKLGTAAKVDNYSEISSVYSFYFYKDKNGKITDPYNMKLYRYPNLDFVVL